MFSLAFGIFLGSYINNTNLRKTVDTTVQSIIGQGIDLLNNKSGGTNNVSTMAEQSNEQG